MERNYYGSLLNYLKFESRTTPETQKQQISIENSSTVNNTATATSNEFNVHLNE
ncbi:Hypothetical protein CINCED_3A009167, partial [Cinara cedri]